MLSNYFFRVFLALCWLLLVIPAKSQMYDIQNYNTSHGLSQGFIPSIIQDSEGFIWMGTKNGLNRFDGKRFKNFIHDPFNTHSISNNFVTSLASHQNFIVAGTYGGGISILDKESRLFYRMPENLIGSDRLQSPSIRFLEVDSEGNIWVILWERYLDGVLQKITLPNGFWSELTEVEDPWEGTQIDLVTESILRSFYLDQEKNQLFYTVDSTIWIVDISSGNMEMISFNGKEFREVHSDSRGNIWFLYEYGMLSFDGDNFREYQTDIALRQFLGIRFDKEFFVVSPDKKLYIARKSAENPGRMELELVQEVAETSIFSSLVDQSSNFWLGSNGYGLYKISHQKVRFETYFPGVTVYSPPFFGEHKGVGFFDDIVGVRCSDDIGNHPICEFKNELPDQSARSRYLKGHDGLHWLYYLMDNRHHRLLSIDDDGKIHNRIKLIEDEGRPGHFKMDSEGNIWIAANGILIKWDVENQLKTQWDYKDILPFGHDVKSIEITYDGTIWLGTSKGLISVSREETNLNFKLWQNDPNDKKSLFYEDVTSLHEDRRNSQILWVGTMGGGLNRLDLNSEEFTHFTRANGLPDDVIYGILQDGHHHLWLSTNNGLVEFDPETEEVLNLFNKKDGLQGEEFNTWAYGQDEDGKMVFGGILGMNVFRPDEFTANEYLPELYITDLKVNGEKLTPCDGDCFIEKSVEYLSSITLPHDANNLAIEFAALEFTQAEKNSFKYYLEGAENEWMHSGEEPVAHYINLPPGSYTFKLMGSNGDQQWSPQVVSLDITILPPWYSSNLAYATYVILGLLLLFWFLRNQISRIKLREKLNFERQEALRIKELEQFKSHLFTNLTHEFRTPLSIILGAGEKLKSQIKSFPGPASEEETKYKEQLNHGLLLIERNAENLHELINQMLDLAKAEDQKLELDYMQSDIISFINAMIDNCRSMAAHKGVKIEVNSNVGSLIMDFDAEKVRQIFSNLVSNAIKFAPPNSEIIIIMDLLKVNEKDYFYLGVKDFGIGVEEEDIKYIFQRFYQGKNKVSKLGGTGIGLTLTKELVELMNGEIKVESKVGKETLFSVKLPVSNSAPIAQAGVESLYLKRPAYQKMSPSKIRYQKGIREDAPTVLLVEDNSDVVDLLIMILEGNFHILIANDGNVAVEMAFDKKPDLIISDVMMPGKDGFEICEILKQDKNTEHIPIILLTARADHESKIEGLKKGADFYIAKPFQAEELLVTIDRAINKVVSNYQ